MSTTICIVTPEFPPRQWGGLARTVGKVAEHASAMGFKVHVAHFTVEPSPVVLLDENRETVERDGMVVHHITVAKETFQGRDRELWDCPHTLTIQMMYQSLELLHRQEGFSLFHSFFLYPVGYVTGLLARRMKVPTIATIVGNDVKKYMFSPEKAALCRSGLENADRVVALSRDLVEMADALSPIEDKACIVFNSVDIPPVEWQPGVAHDRAFRVGCAGIFKYAKGLSYLIKAAGELVAEFPLTVELLGQLRASEQDAYEAMVRRTDMEDRIVFRGPLSHDRIPEWLASLDVFVLPSVSEGCPTILMEALAVGVPSVATRVGAVETLIEDRVSGVLIPWGDSAAVRDALRYVRENPVSAQNMGLAARLKMREFSRERERRQWERVYNELLVPGTTGPQPGPPGA